MTYTVLVFMPRPWLRPKSLSEKLEYWMERYSKETEDKQQELNTVKTNVNNNRMRLQELANKVGMFSFVLFFIYDGFYESGVLDSVFFSLTVQ